MRECATTFEFVYHFDSVDEWLSYMAAFWQAAVIEPAVVTRSRALLPPGDGELRIHQRMYAARLRRIAS